MDRMNRISRLRVLAALCGAAMLAGCTIQDQEAPALAGPSGFGRTLTLTATPDNLPRDGSSSSTIQVNYRDGSTNEPLVQHRLLVSASAGTLSMSEVVTDQAGNASVTFIAPGLNTPVTTVSVTVTPVGSDAANTVSNRVWIDLAGPEFPTPTFEFTPATPLQFQNVTFNASSTTLGGSTCSECSYSWNFGDGDSGSGVVLDHAFQSRGSFVVRLTVGTPAGTSNTISRTVTVGDPAAPEASFVFSPTQPDVNDDVHFDASASRGLNGANIVEYRWNFGDGVQQTTTSATIDHNFPNAATEKTYLVTLVVVDSNGQTGTASREVGVEP